MNATGFPEWQHRFERTVPYVGDGYGPRALFTVEAGLHYLQGNALPYFSVTAEVRVPGRRDIECGGTLHDAVVRHFPELAPVVAMHLSDSNGQPMHAKANGWYQLAGYFGGAGERYHAGNGDRQHWKADGSFDGYRPSSPEECLVSWAEYVRLPLDRARDLVAGWQTDVDRATELGLPVPRLRDIHDAWCDLQVDRWRVEATAAIALLDSLIAATAAR